MFRIIASISWGVRALSVSHKQVASLPLWFAAALLLVGGAVCPALHAQTKVKSPARTKPGETGISKSSGSTKARKEQSKGGSGPADYTSKNFLIHTDLPPAEAQDLLKKLEVMLALIAEYWGRPPSGIIECYVVKDLSNWQNVPLDANGLASIEGGAGVTISRTMTRGDAFVAKSVVYAVADRGTPQHEAVHAYCVQAFGRTGPVWYSEGMAEMGQYWRQGDKSVNAHDVVIDYLRKAEPKSLNEIVNGVERTGDSWENYAWRWALCHLLANNPNYASRFRPLGLGILTKSDMTFESTYGTMAKEISFEYLHFLKHVEKGYRVDLCHWDWKAKFKPNRNGVPVSPKVDAAHGWQPSKLTLVKDDEYEYSCTGTWATDKAGNLVDAGGGTGGAGKLVGVIMRDYELGQPFDLGAYGSFTAAADGDLYLRCQDQWNEIADNKGKLSVRLKVKGKGTPLAPPTPSEGSGDTRKPDTPAKTPQKSK